MGGSSSRLNYTRDKVLREEGPGSLFSIHHGVGTDQPNEVTVFSFTKRRDQAELLLAAARNAALARNIIRSKTIRHPSIVKFLDSADTTDALHIVCEPVIPLSSCLDSLVRSHVCLGLSQIITALQFLHESKLSHNNLSLQSIYIHPETLEWRLGGLEFTLPPQELTPQLLEATKAVRHPDSIPPEEAAGKPSTHIHSRDAWALGKLLTALLPNVDAGGLPELIASLTSADPSQRPPVNAAMNTPFFRDDVLLNVVQFLSTLTLKEPHEKKAFFQELADKLRSLKTSDVVSLVLPKILVPTVIADTASIPPFLPHLFAREDDPETSIGGVLPRAEYDRTILPCILHWYSSTDRALRIALLTHLQVYIRYFDPLTFQTEIFRHIMQGLRDSNAVIVKVTLSALRVLVGYWLSLLEGTATGETTGQERRLIDQSILVTVARIAELDADSNVRVYALDYLVDIWCLDRSTTAGTQILETMLRALGDPAPAVRVAALRGHIRIKSNLPQRLLVKKILPAMLPHICAPEREVREQAHKTMHEILRYVQSLPLRESDLIPVEPAGVVYITRTPVLTGTTPRDLTGAEHGGSGSSEPATPTRTHVAGKPPSRQLTMTAPSPSGKDSDAEWGAFEDDSNVEKTTAATTAAKSAVADHEDSQQTDEVFGDNWSADDTKPKDTHASQKEEPAPVTVVATPPAANTATTTVVPPTMTAPVGFDDIIERERNMEERNKETTAPSEPEIDFFADMAPAHMASKKVFLAPSPPKPKSLPRKQVEAAVVPPPGAKPSAKLLLVEETSESAGEGAAWGEEEVTISLPDVTATASDDAALPTTPQPQEPAEADESASQSSTHTGKEGSPSETPSALSTEAAESSAVDKRKERREKRREKPARAAEGGEEGTSNGKKGKKSKRIAAVKLEQKPSFDSFDDGEQ